MDIIDLAKLRAERDRPDPDCRRVDEHGAELSLFALQYSMDGKTWCSELWAYSMQDAENRVKAMRASLDVLGQVHAIINA